MADWRYPGVPQLDRDLNSCDGCHECALRCTAGVQMTEEEFLRIVEHLRGLDPRQVTRVLDQDKQVTWFEDTNTEACLFQDVTRGGCIVYPARPLVCRLFGQVEWLPCPLGRRLPQVRDGLELIQAYAEERRATFPEWCVARGLFDFKQLLSADG